jgi:hypothetical protein
MTIRHVEKFLLIAGVALFLALMPLWGWSTVSVEERMLQLQLDQIVPQHAADLRDESGLIKALFIDYAEDPFLGAKAHLALQRYPEMSRLVLVEHGTDPEFQEQLRNFGELIVPPIHYFMTHPVRTWNMYLQNFSSDEELTATERGRFAIAFIGTEGHDFLGQFLLGPEGEVTWLFSERILEGINAFFAGGIRGLESKVRSGQDVGPADLGWAAVDVAVGVSAFKILRLGRAAAVGSRSLTFSQRSAALGSSLLRASVIGARLVKYGAPVALAYLVVRHPSLLHSLLADLALHLGLPVAAVQTAGWFLIVLPLIYLLYPLLRPLAFLLIWSGTRLRSLVVRPT